MIAARGDEGRFASTPLYQLEAQDAAVEGKRPFQVGDLEVHVTDAHAVGDRALGHRIGKRPQPVDRIAHRAVLLLSAGAGAPLSCQCCEWTSTPLSSASLPASSRTPVLNTWGFKPWGFKPWGLIPVRPSRNAAKSKVMWC